jgi:hypothetical protein
MGAGIVLPKHENLNTGNPDPATASEHWSRFIEASGRFVLAVCAAVFRATRHLSAING